MSVEITLCKVEDGRILAIRYMTIRELENAIRRVSQRFEDGTAGPYTDRVLSALTAEFDRRAGEKP